MRQHPFKPLITKKTQKLLVGTLPPEDVPFYFSNSSNTRLWDILKAISETSNEVRSGGNSLSDGEKVRILDSLKIGISDIIYKYERDKYDSTKDKDIEPIEYNDLLKVAFDNGIVELLFVYKSAYKWFVHSLISKVPVRLRKIRNKCGKGEQEAIKYKGVIIKCTILPAPLNRGRRGETLKSKLDFYREHILK